MSAEVTMTISERRKYFLRMRLRYMQASRPERSRLLDEMAQVTELQAFRSLQVSMGAARCSV